MQKPVGMVGRGTVRVVALAILVANVGCGGDATVTNDGGRPSCSPQGQVLGNQILSRRDQDVAIGYLPQGAHPCALTSRDIDQLNRTQPARIAQYADACAKYRANGCD